MIIHILQFSFSYLLFWFASFIFIACPILVPATAATRTKKQRTETTFSFGFYFAYARASIRCVISLFVDHMYNIYIYTWCPTRFRPHKFIWLWVSELAVAACAWLFSRSHTFPSLFVSSKFIRIFLLMIAEQFSVITYPHTPHHTTPHTVIFELRDTNNKNESKLKREKAR